MQSALKLLSYNVWFDSAFLVARTHHIVKLIEAEVPDVVCLQEVTPQSYNILRERLEHAYTFSLPFKQRYFVSMMVHRRHRPMFDDVRMPSEMGRSLLVGYIHLSSKADTVRSSCDLVVATSHFESLSSRPLRRRQLEVAAALLRNFPGRWVLCGDFNFCSYQNFRGVRPDDLENAVLGEVLPPHVDAWAFLHPSPQGQPSDDAWRGYTFDSEKNLNISHPERMRYDRVVASSATTAEGGCVVPREIRLFGTDPIDGDIIAAYPPDPEIALTLPRRAQTSEQFATPPKAVVEEMVVYPSDHFGLLCGLICYSSEAVR